MLEKHFGRKLPEQVKIFIHEEDANTLHFSIPMAPSNLAELSDDDLERVAGGTDFVLTLMVGAWVISATLTGGAVAAGAGAITMMEGMSW